MKRTWHEASAASLEVTETERYSFKEIIEAVSLFKEKPPEHQQMLNNIELFVKQRVPWKTWTAGEVVGMLDDVVEGIPIDYTVHKYTHGFREPTQQIVEPQFQSAVVPSIFNFPQIGAEQNYTAPEIKRRKMADLIGVEKNSVSALAVEEIKAVHVELAPTSPTDMEEEEEGDNL